MDGLSVGAAGSYNFTNVTAPRTISATFTANGPNNITASAGAGGSISSPGASSVACGGSKSYTITPNACFTIADVLVDGVSVGAVGSYNFTNVTTPRTIAASFVASSPYGITASAGAGGSISSPGASSVACGGSKSYTITPNACFTIADVLVDGLSVGAAGSYNFTNVTAPRTISATFTANGPNNITASAGAGGSISSPGVSSVACGGSKSYTITPNACFTIADVLVDGISVGAVGSYNFTNVTAPRTISATFTANGPNNITASAGAGGSISSPGASSVACGGSKSYTITPNACFTIADVLVDGVSVGAAGSYNFTNVTVPRTISASFTASGTYTLSALAGAGGSISPSGVTSAACGSSQTYTITPDAGFVVEEVLIDGVLSGPLTTHTFTNITAPHTIQALFTEVVAEGEGEGNGDPIQITGPDLNVDARVGESYTFVVVATGGAAALQYQWYRQTNGGPLEPIGNDTPDYTLSNITPTDAGVYYCIVTDGIDIAVSQQSTLTVLAALPLSGWSAVVLVIGGIIVLALHRASARRNGQADRSA